MAEQPKSNGGVGADLSNTPNFDNTGSDFVQGTDYSNAGVDRTKAFEDLKNSAFAFLETAFQKAYQEPSNKAGRYPVDTWIKIVQDALVEAISKEDAFRDAVKPFSGEKESHIAIALKGLVQEFISNRLFDRREGVARELKEVFEARLKATNGQLRDTENLKRAFLETIGLRDWQQPLIDDYLSRLMSSVPNEKSEGDPANKGKAGADASQVEPEIGADLANVPSAPEAGADVSDVPEPAQPAESAQPPMPSESQAPADNLAHEPSGTQGDVIGEEIDDQVKRFLDSIYDDAAKYANKHKVRNSDFGSFANDLSDYLVNALGKKKLGGKDRKAKTKSAQEYILSRYFDEHGEPTQELEKLLEEAAQPSLNYSEEFQRDVELDFRDFNDNFPGWFGWDKKEKARDLFREYLGAQENGTAPSAPSTPSPNDNPSPSQNPAEENPGSSTKIPDFLDFAYFKGNLGYEPFDITKMKGEPEYGEKEATPEHEDNRKQTQAFVESFLEANPFASNRRIRQEARKHGVDITATKWVDAVRNKIAETTGFSPTPAQQQIGDAMYSLMDSITADDETRSQYILDLETQGAIYDRQPTKAGFFDRVFKSSGYNKRKEAVEQKYVQRTQEENNLIGDIQAAAAKGDVKEVERLQKELKDLQKEISNLNVTFQRLNQGFKDFDTPKEKADDYADKAKALMEELKNGIDSLTGQWVSDKPMSPELEAYVRTDDDEKRRRILGGTKGRDRQNEDEQIAQYIAREKQRKEDKEFRKKAANAYRQYQYAQRGEKIGAAFGKPLSWMGVSKAPAAFGKVGGAIGSAAGKAWGALAGPVGAILVAIGVVVSVIKMGIRTVDAAVQKAFQSAPFNGRIAAAKMQYEGEEFSRKQRFASGTEESSTELIEAWSDLKEESQDMVIAFANLKNTLLTGLVAFAQYSASLLKMAGQIMGMNQLLPKVMSVLSKAVSIIQNSKGAFEEIKDNREYEKEQDAQAGRQQQELALIKAGNLARKYFETGEFDEDAFNGSSYAKAGYTKEKMIAALNDENRRDEFEDAIAFNDVKRGGDFFQGYRNLSGEAPTSKEDLRDVLKTLQSSYVQQVMANEHQAEIQKNTEETAKNTRKDEEKLASIGEGPLWDALMRSANKYNPTGAGTEAANGAEWGEPSRQYGRFAAEGARQQNWGRR